MELNLPGGVNLVQPDGDLTIAGPLPLAFLPQGPVAVFVQAEFDDVAGLLKRILRGIDLKLDRNLFGRGQESVVGGR